MLKFREIILKNVNFSRNNINDVEIEQILISNKHSIIKNYFKYFSGYVNNCK